MASRDLEVEGILRRIQISFPDTDDSSQDFDVQVLEDDDDDDEHEIWRDIGHSWDEYFGEVCVLRLDTQLEEPVLDCWCLFITLQQWFDSGASRDLACLVLEDVDGEEEKFRRIGTIVFKHTLALKMRYWMAGDLGDNVWNKIQDAINRRQNQLRPDRRRAEDSEYDSEAPAAADSNEPANAADVEAEKRLEGIDALYQFDDLIDSKRFDGLFDQLEPVRLTIV